MNRIAEIVGYVVLVGAVALGVLWAIGVALMYHLCKDGC